MHSDFDTGHAFPDVALPDHTKTERRLSALQGDDPMLLVLIRGLCPKDREQLTALTRFHPQLEVGSCRLVVITSDDWHTTHTLRTELDARYPFLYDEDRRVCGALDPLWPAADDEPHLPVPHTWLLAPRMQIRRVWNGHYHWNRPTTCELHDALCELTRELRRDWECRQPEARRHWRSGDHAGVYPYGSRTMEQTLKDAARAASHPGRVS